MEESVVDQLEHILNSQQHEEQQRNLRSGIEQVAVELMRVTSVMGTAISQVAENASASDRRVVEELQSWSSGLEARVSQAIRQLSSEIPDANAIQNLAEKTANKSVEQVNQNLEAATQHINQCCKPSMENLTGWLMN